MSRADQVDGILGGLSSPTAEDVYLATDSYDARALAAAAAKRALEGGGGGTSQPTIQTVKKFSAADLLAQNPADPDSWQEVLPELSGERFYQVQSVVATIHPGDTPYAEAPAFQFVTPGDSDLYWQSGGTLMLDLATAKMQTFGPDIAEQDQYAPGRYTGANSPLMLYLNPQPADGNGTVTLCVTAFIIDTAAA